MKRDIQICYNDIESICKSLDSFRIALEEIATSMKKFDSYIQMNSGKTINELIDKNNVINDELNICKEEVTDLYDIFSDYIDATTYYIKPVNPSAMMRVDRNDIWWNLFSVSSVKASCDNLEFLKYRQYGTTSAAFYLDEDERERENRKLRHNYEEMEDYRSKFCRIYDNIQDELDELERIYKNKIIEFENEDDYYAGKASELYDKYSSRGEKIWDFVEGAGKAIYDFVDGVVTTVDDLVTGILSLIGGSVIFTAADIVYLATYPFGVTPKWASDCVTEVDTTVKAILEDPVLIVEGMAQEGSDTVEEKGVAFGVGFVGGSIATELLVSKGLGKLKALNKMDDVARVASKTDDAGDIARNANILSDSADDVAEAGAKAGVVEGGKTVEQLTADSVKQAIEKNGITVEEFSDLLNPNRVLSDSEMKLVQQVRNDIGLPSEGTIMNKTIPQSDIYKYLYDDNYNGVRGFVSVDEHSNSLSGLDNIYEGNRLDYNNTAFKNGYGVDGISQSVGAPDTIYGKITYVLSDSKSVKIPTDAPTINNAPYTGRGFTGSQNIVLPELVQNQRSFINGDVLEIYDSTTGALTQQFVYDSKLGWIIKN